MSTLRVRPPRNKGGATPKRGQARGKTGPQEVQSWLFKYRFQLWPYWAMIVIFLLAVIVMNPVILAAGYALVAAGLWFGGQYLRLTKPRHRLYASGLAVSAGAWSVWFVLSANAVRPVLSLPFFVTIVSIPWFRYRSGHSTIPVTFAPELTGVGRRRMETRANNILNNWPTITRQGRVQFAELDGLRFDGITMDVDLTLRGGQTSRTIMHAATRTALISAFDAPEDSLRVLSRAARKPGQSGRAREITLRFILHDINAESLGAPPDGVDTMGRFETGEPVEYVDRAHTVIAGQTDHGKSVLMNLALRRKIRKGWAVIGVDLKFGALELTPWAPVLAYLVDRKDKLKRILEGLIEEMEWRGAEMAARGLRQWEPTAEHPNICLTVDEVQEVNQVPGAMALLTRLSQLGRAYGFELLLATQYPKDTNLPADIMAQVSQIFCLHLEKPTHDRVVFGENASTEGWTPSAIKAGVKGVFYVRSPKHMFPSRAKGWFMTVDEIKAEIPTMTRVTIKRPWMPGSSEALRSTQEGVDMLPGGREEEDIVEAVVVSESPVETVVEAIRSGAGTPDLIVEATGMAKRTVNEILVSLVDNGRITKDGSRATRLRPWRVVE